MNKLILTLLLLLTFFSYPIKSEAHIPGQPPFFRINGELTDYYKIVSDYPSNDFLIPQDTSPKPFLVNEEITFEIDKSLLPFPEEVIEETTFTWDMGDQTTTEGYTHTHRYKVPGTYLLTIQADFGKFTSESGVQEKYIQSLFVDVVSDPEFTLPKAEFKANDKDFNNETNYIEANLSEEVTLDAGPSVPSVGGEITDYTWYFDTGEIKEGQVVNVTFDSNPYLATPILRVTDSNGFITDTQITLKNTHFGEKPINSVLVFGIGLLIIIGGLLIPVFVYLKKK